eukprot:948663-Prymnesium_polylepis.1
MEAVRLGTHEGAPLRRANHPPVWRRPVHCHRALEEHGGLPVYAVKQALHRRRKGHPSGRQAIKQRPREHMPSPSTPTPGPPPPPPPL